MPFYRINGMAVHIKFSGKGAKHPPAPCAARIPVDECSRTVGPTQRCCAISSYLCDWQLVDGRTCDAPLCADHVTEVGANRHYCPLHLAEHRDAEPELF